MAKDLLSIIEQKLRNAADAITALREVQFTPELAEHIRATFHPSRPSTSGVETVVTKRTYKKRATAKRAETKPAPETKRTRTMSSDARRRLSKLMKARWAKAHREGRTTVGKT